MQRAAERTLGRYNILYVSLVFAALHIGYKSVLDVVFVFVVAFFFGWVVNRTSNLLGVTFAHGLTNITLFLLTPFLLGSPAELPPGVPAQAPMVSSLPATRQSMVTEPSEMTPSPCFSATLSREPISTTRRATTAEPPSIPPLKQAVRVHVVEAGENLYQISLIYGVTWGELVESNGLTGAGDIRPGQRLEIPEAGEGRLPALGEPPLLPTTHRVRPGENLFRIGLIYGIPWPSLAAANGLPDGDILTSGQILVIPNIRPASVQVGD